MMKTAKRWLRIAFNVTVLLTVYVLYTMVVFFAPDTEEGVRKLVLTVILAIASSSDIRRHKIPLIACIAVLGINVTKTAFVSVNPASWIISFVLFAFLLIIYIINKDLIGLGDIILITLCVQSLFPEKIFKFLFLTFVFSTFAGLFKCLKAKKLKNVTVPLTPCIAVSFVLLMC